MNQPQPRPEQPDDGPRVVTLFVPPEIMELHNAKLTQCSRDMARWVELFERPLESMKFSDRAECHSLQIFLRTREPEEYERLIAHHMRLATRALLIYQEMPSVDVAHEAARHLAFAGEYRVRSNTDAANRLGIPLAKYIDAQGHPMNLPFEFE